MPPKYPSTKFWPVSETIHRDDTVHDDPEFFVGREVVVTEKYDGGNTCLFMGEVYARSVQAPSHDGWMAMVRKHHAWKSVNKKFDVFYGEDIYGIHSIEYDAVMENETFYLFAHRLTNDTKDLFSSWDDTIDAAKDLEVKMVPELFRGTFTSVDEITKFFKTQLVMPSVLGPNREGCVMRIVDQFDADEFPKAVCKYVRENHVQTDEHWRKNWQPCEIKR